MFSSGAHHRLELAPTQGKLTMIIENQKAETYHADREHVSKHGLDLIRKCPALYKYHQDTPTKRTPSMRWGSLVHTWVLEPEKILEEYVIAPDDLDRRTSAGKRFLEVAQLSGLEIVTEEENTQLLEIRESILKNSEARRILLEAQLIEPSVYWMDKDSEVLCRARPDIVGANLITDLKTTKDIRGFEWDAMKFRYHVQAAFYCDALKISRFNFIVVEKEPPYLCQVFCSDDFFLARGRDEYRKDLEVYAECLTSGVWNGLPEVRTISLR